MGRGSNLLFNPPRITKSKIAPLEAIQEFTSEVNKLLFLDEETLLSRDLHSTVRVYKIIDDEIRMRSGRNILSSSLLGATGDKFVISEKMGEEEEFILTLLNDNTEDIEIDLPPLPSGHEAYDLILTSSYLYAPALNEGYSHLYRISLDSSDAEWIEMAGYRAEEELGIIDSGERTILLFPKGSQERRGAETMLTLGPGGLGSSFPTSNTELETERALQSPHLLSPGRVDGTYIACQENEQGEESLFFFDLQNGVSHPFFGLHGERALDLQQAGSKIFLLREKELLLFNENDLQLAERLPLKGTFTRLASSPGQVILWNEGKNDYQRITLKER